MAYKCEIPFVCSASEALISANQFNLFELFNFLPRNSYHQWMQRCRWRSETFFALARSRSFDFVLVFTLSNTFIEIHTTTYGHQVLIRSARVTYYTRTLVIMLVAYPFIHLILVSSYHKANLAVCPSSILRSHKASIIGLIIRYLGATVVQTFRSTICHVRVLSTIKETCSLSSSIFPRKIR